MQWYISKLVFQLINNEMLTTQFNEQVKLIGADDELQAFNKARIIGDNTCLQCKSGETTIKFIDVSELQLLTEVKDGLSLISNLVCNVSAEDYICKTQKSASYLFQKGLHDFAATNNF